MAVQREHDVVVDYGDLAVTGGISVFDKRFDEMYYYGGNDLGAAYTPGESRFRVWAPTASEAEVVFYESWNDEKPAQVLPMKRDVQGTWLLVVEGDHQGRYYTYRVKIGQDWNEAADPYAKAVGVNGDRAVVIDLQSTNPERWGDDRKPPFEAAVDAVIYELHVKDLSSHPHSGITQKGKFLGLAESGTRGPNGILTGLDHIAALGVTHVQLLPVYDYATESVDETKLDQPQYNWGYDPKNYNVPEGSYATDPSVPGLRITELKRAVQALHERGLRVIMDVVYNHVYDWYLINFTKLVPGYYLRYKEDGTLSNGSFCGNECASERPMMRKFIVDSVLYWAAEYHMDGFRFDLMGLMDIETMNEIRRRLDELDPTIITIGEGWIMDTVLPDEQRAHQNNAAKFPGIGHFNDDYRDAIKGSIFYFAQRGFISGGAGYEGLIREGIVGAIDYDGGIRNFGIEPGQSVNYVECHDNHTLWDKIVLSAAIESEEHRSGMHRLASAIILTSQGIPFLHAGQEFMRTKNGEENSYQSPIEVNWLDWERCAARQNDVAYMRELIALRKSHPAFRLRTAEQIREHLHFEPAPEHCVAYTLSNHAGGDPAKHIYVLYKGTEKTILLNLPGLGNWTIRFGGEYVAALEGRSLKVRGLGMVVLTI
ncbi:type I pullulanase [Paenibacillus fonticola]|uniref:type I pullulanase n=1 Tax=Paenibacillus fonticola TaxID=379896 RepID=UPI000380C5DC|nr:type I pullulanase [Paenibacillus fonticola]